MIYHQRGTDADERMEQLLMDADKLLVLCESDYNDSTEYDLFVRCLSEQTIVENEKRRTDYHKFDWKTSSGYPCRFRIQ